MPEIVNKQISVEDLVIMGVSCVCMLQYNHIEEDEILKIQNNRDKLLMLLFLYNKNIKINLPIIDTDVAVYGKKCKLFESIKVILLVVFI